MSENSKIEWTHHTFNPWWGCSKVSPACDNCYAEREAKRFNGDRMLWGVHADRREFGDKHWIDPVKWNAKASEAGERRRVFCASMADVFDKNAPIGARERLWKLIEETPNLDWLLLTKRIGNVQEMIPIRWLAELPRNIWLGITVINQEEADRDIPKLLRVPAAVRFLSMEPLLGPVDLWKYFDHGSKGSWKYGLDWVIVGGESGPEARPMHPDWARSLRDQCGAAGVPFLFKQWGEWISADQKECPTGPSWLWRWSDGKDYERGLWRTASQLMCRAGKKAAGRMLDGRTHDGFPEFQPT
jgi:protein gp37